MAHVLIVVNDLFFADRLSNGLTASGHGGQVVDLSTDDLPDVSPQTDLLIIDLEAGPAALDLIRAGKAAGKPVIAFGPHTDLELRQRALGAGADQVVAKSRLVTGFAELISAAIRPQS